MCWHLWQLHYPYQDLYVYSWQPEPLRCEFSIYIVFRNSLFTVRNTKLAAITQTTPTVTSCPCSMPVVQSVFLSIICVWIGPKSVCKVIHYFFKSIFFKFPILNLTTLTLSRIDLHFNISVVYYRVTTVVHLFTWRVIVSTLRLVLCHLVLRLDAHWDSLMFTPGSPATSNGFN